MVGHVFLDYISIHLISEAMPRCQTWAVVGVGRQEKKLQTLDGSTVALFLMFFAT